ncbi:MAG: tetratricopeptide repeat protein, partial [Anaerolineales bacterium]|nr:tetratricopeptide repeat protein [Anaerolineales bacterium]
MKRNYTQMIILIIFIGTLFIGGRYLLFDREPQQNNQQISQETTITDSLPVLTPIPTSTPILPPLQSTIPGDVYYFYGDWESAISSYQRTVDTSSSAEEISRALLGLGKVYYQKQDYQKALEYLRLLVSTYPDSALIHKGFFALAETYTALDRHLEAADAYNLYLSRRPGILDAFVQHRRGNELSTGGEPIQAIEAYQAAIAAGSADSLYTLQLKIGEQYAALEDHATAIVIYKDVYSQSSNDYAKARSDFLLGLSYLELDQRDLAEAAFQDAVIQYPLSYDSYLALVELVNGGFLINDLDRGLVDYFAGQYSHAIEAFDRYLIEPEAGDRGTALYYKGFALRAMGRHEEALLPWDAIISQYPDHSYWDQAWEFKAYSLWFYLSRYSEASQVLQEFVSKNPFHPRAAEFLFDAARVEELTGDLESAAEIWKRVFNEYPTSTYANLSLFKSGISQVRLGAHGKALELFSLYRDATQSFEELSQALFWIGKIYQIQGNPDAAHAAWSEAANADPTGYYSERARDLLQNRQPFTPPLDYDIGFDVMVEKQEAQDWIKDTFSIPPETNLESLGLLGDDPRIVRGTEFWELGLYSEARAEFEALRNEVSFDPISSYRLANYYVDLGLYRPAIFAAREVLNAANLDDAETINGPAYLNHIRFGTYYSDLVIPAGQEYGFHPLLLFSIIRQESLFEGFVRSTAGARGLMQIMPSTGTDLVDREGWPPDYSDEDLYRPQVSIKLGTAYLAFLRSYYDGDIYATLAAYNAGGGNTNIWLEEAQGDQDLFLEIIRFSETETYLKTISEVFAIYRRLYT